MYFFWQKTVTGKWTPVKSAEPPTKPAYGGFSGPVKGLVEITDPESNFDLESLAELYPLERAA